MKVPGSSSSTFSDAIVPSVAIALEAPPPRREAVAPGDRLDRHEADIVPVGDVAGPRIAEPDEEAHGSEARSERFERSGTGSRQENASLQSGSAFFTKPVPTSATRLERHVIGTSGRRRAASTPLKRLGRTAGYFFSAGAPPAAGAAAGAAPGAAPGAAARRHCRCCRGCCRTAAAAAASAAAFISSA